MTFTDLNLIPEIIKSIIESGYTIPTPIQETAIPKILEGSDLLASAQTGSGKTAAFLLPALQQLTTRPRKGKGKPRILILVPTRELAMQVAGQAQKYSKHMSKVRTVCIYGGAPYPIQNRQLSSIYEILVATPGRLIDHLERGRIDLSSIDLFVLDEADRMLDMGFIKPVQQIAAQLPDEVQTIMFSATLEDDSILKLSKQLLTNPFEIRLASSKNKHENIDQSLFFADGLEHKLKLLNNLLQNNTSNQTIIFTSTKAFANELTSILNQDGHAVGVLHGDLDQRQRTRTLHRLREGNISILVATDVAARGIDISTISHVINFDLPNNVEDYTHRIGRTGRAEAKGFAVSLATAKDQKLIAQIKKQTNQEIPVKTIEGLEPRKDINSPNQSFRKNRSRRFSKPAPHWQKNGQQQSKKPFGQKKHNKKPNFAGK